MARRTMFRNARLLDPASGRDEPGALLMDGDVIEDLGPSLLAEAFGPDIEQTDCEGLCVAPGLIDLHVATGEPGAEHKETLKSAGRAAAAGGVTTLVVSPDTDPPIDARAIVDFVLRRARDASLVRIYPAGALTRGLAGERIAEIGLMREAGAVLFSNGGRTIANSATLRRAMLYAGGFGAGGFGAPVMHRPLDPFLGGGVMNAGHFADRLGLPGVPAAAESIGVFRDLRLAEATGAHFLLDQISAAESLPLIAAAKARGIDAGASVSAAHLALNELDIGEYRTFARLSPPLRTEEDRQALVAALREGVIDIVTSGHDPRPTEEKRLPFEEASAGGVGLETLLPTLLTLVAEGRIPLLRALFTVTAAPAVFLGLPQGRLARGAPADCVIFDPLAPWRLNAENLRSKSRNSPFDGRLFQGMVARTLVGGRIVFDSGRLPASGTVEKER